MSTLNLRSRIEEDHLTCTICFNTFTAPKALPCLHTFCEQCLREYVVSRGYDSSGEFPCPICRQSVKVPAGGFEQFPDNHLLKSLLDTVDNTKSKPTPKPRRSLQPKPDEVNLNEAPPVNIAVTLPTYDCTVGPAIGYYEGMDRRGPLNSNSSDPPNLPVCKTKSPDNGRAQTMGVAPPSTFHSGPLLYPAIPQLLETDNSACTQGLQLRFGKKGANVTDFHKPYGLAVSDQCDYVVTDMGGNRIFIYDYRGEPKRAFHCECRIKDVTVNNKNEILVVVNKAGAALRCYDMFGKLLGEHGKFITHEETSGISHLYGGGVVITGIQNHSVYILTDQYKVSSKFGRKGVGDGYFQSPVFVTTDSKDHIIVSDDVNHNVQVFNNQGKFKLRFGGKGSQPGQLLQPMGVTTDADDNIIVADSGNCRVEVFTSRGTHIRTVVSNTNQLGENVRPVNVAMTPRGNVAVLMKGSYFAEVRVYSPFTNSSHTQASVKDSATWYLVN